MTRIARHVRTNMVAYVALFFALGLGTAWALEANSIKSKHIKDGQVRSQDVANDTGTKALTEDDIAQDTLTGGDIDQNAIDGGEVIPDGLQGIDIEEASLEGVDAAAVDGASQCTGTTVVDPSGSGSANLCVLGNITLRGSCGGGGGTVGAIELDSGEPDVFYGARGDAVMEDGDFDAADPAVLLVTETHPTPDGQSTASPPMSFYASGPSGTMGGTAGMRAYNNGPGDQACVFATAISMQPG